MSRPPKAVAASLARFPEYVGHNSRGGSERRRTTHTIREGEARGCAGAAAVEFALVAPFLFLLILGAAQFGLTWNNYVVLTHAVSAGVHQLAISRGTATPRTDTLNRIFSAAPNLTQSSLTTTISVNGTACATDALCATALSTTTGCPTSGCPATVTASYPCALKVMGLDYAPGCRLSSTTSERIE